MTIGTAISPPAPPVSAAPDQPPQFFTLQSIGSLAGASTGLYLVVGTLSKVTEWKFPAWFPLLVAIALVVCIDLAGTNLWQGARPREIPARILVLALNSCLVYSSAVGGALALSNVQPEPPSVASSSPTPSPPTASPTPKAAPTPAAAPTAPPDAAPNEFSATHRSQRAERRAGFSRLVDALQE